MYILAEHPTAPFTTLAGETKGPCVNVGVATVHGAPIFVGQQETRSILKAFGWPAPETVAAAEAARDTAVAMADELAAKLAEACEQIAALEVVAGMRQANSQSIGAAT